MPHRKAMMIHWLCEACPVPIQQVHRDSDRAWRPLGEFRAPEPVQSAVGGVERSPRTAVTRARAGGAARGGPRDADQWL
ncbi:hypothetical protein SKAU_G00368270 [Synaphobranchus kaupii]|uniref:Uncharacterized protein n=1 Tax=Synaphobranchus kaupii TaxID=118154 RepID=A0A9Q1IFP9_SYNKA|nr:hypothetical protein SKAU_G00368270 [Synaphobranchus kaupii]